MKKGDLVRNKRTGETGTIVREPWTKLFTDAQDWAANAAGFDSCTAARAIRICWHKNGYERTYKYSEVSRSCEVINDANCSSNLG